MTREEAIDKLANLLVLAGHRDDLFKKYRDPATRGPRDVSTTMNKMEGQKLRADVAEIVEALSSK